MEDTQRVNIDVDRDLWKRVGVRAIEEDTEKRRIVDKALRLYLGDPGSMVSTKKRIESRILPPGAKALVASYIRMPDGSIRDMDTLSEEEISGLVEAGLLEDEPS